VPHYEVGFYAQPDDYRSPDHAYARPDQLTDAGIDGAELVVELRSPRDETYDKLDWYVAQGVREILVVHPSTRAIELYRTVEGHVRLVDPSSDGSVGLSTLGATRLTTVATTDGPRLRVTAPDGTITDC
jgi:Uma2 family endonuclease